MTAYTVTELQNAQSRRNGQTIEAASLSAAKRKASQMQMFKGTVLEISSESGAVLSRKQAGKWEDA